MADDYQPPTSAEELLDRYAKGERNFMRSSLSEANLEHANLFGADLAESSLSEANLTASVLSLVNLAGADLRRASLNDAHLIDTNLAGATLIDANLGGANVWRSDLTGADLSRAVMSETALADLNLSRAKGLGQIIHVGPSVVDNRTLVKSSNLPVRFLRGIGLSDWQIQATRLNQPDLTRDQVDEIAYAIANARAGRALNLQSVFISYSTADEAFTRKLHDDLQDAGVRCWFFPEDRKGGKKVHEQLSEAIHLHDRLLLCLSETSMASKWVRYEIEKARDREEREGRRVLFPIRLVPYEKLREWSLFDADLARDAAKEIREYYIPDFSGWDTDLAKYQAELARLIKDLTKDDAPKP